MDSQSMFRWWSSLDATWKHFFKTQLRPSLVGELLDQYTPRAEELQSIFGFYHLTIQDISTTILKPLENLALGSLNLRNLANLKSIQEITKLRITHFELSNCPVADLTPLKSARGLRQLNIDGREVRDFSPLSGSSNLNQLRIENGVLPSLDIISPLPLLEVLCLTNVMVHSLKGITEFPMLTDLILENFALHEIELVENTRLNSLDISMTSIQDLTLFDRVLLNEIILPENISREAIRAFAQTHPYCSIYKKNDSEFYWQGKGFFRRYKSYKVIRKKGVLEVGAIIQYDGYQYSHYDGVHIYSFRKKNDNPFLRMKVSITEYEDFSWNDFVEEIT